MDHKALAETYVQLWIHIDNQFKTEGTREKKIDAVNMVFEQTCKRIISDLIGKQRQGVPPKQESSNEWKPTEKQIAWANKLGCDKPEGFSRKELSEWLDEHKND